MKLKLKIDKETLLLLNKAFNDQQILILIGETAFIKRIEKSLIVEIRDILTKKFFTQSKTSTVELYKHSAVVFIEILQAILSSGKLAPDQFVKIDRLKNETHQKIQIL
ncbi:hypothetical protein D1Z98_07505 [Riemerella anatipestifer]|uniref:hypothetical protein n=1 Tax=Riemerella anatipestifer TaxID=34085 RepID=UPI00129D7FCB|nr:hypothetical protein [Riemerella anatipestifer]MRM94819.1 hypothetical protein [Riemerella anatipestifer]